MSLKTVYTAILGLSLLLWMGCTGGPTPPVPLPPREGATSTPQTTSAQTQQATSPPPTAPPTPTPARTPSPPPGVPGPLLIDGLQATRILGSNPLGKTFYAVTPGGLYITNDSGADWTLITARVEHDEFVFGPADPAALYAGTGRLCFRQEPEQPVFKSNDSGFSWARLPITTSLRPAAVDPRDSDRAYAIACDGPYLTTDGGATWAQLPGAPFPDYILTAMAVSPADPDRIYAAGASEGGGGGVFVRAGEPPTWTQVAGGAAQPDLLWITALAVGAQDGRRVFFLEAHGVWRSDDGGMTWQMSSAGLEDVVYQPGSPPEQAGLNALAMDAEGKRLFLGTRRGLYQSEDGGATWSKVTDGPWGEDEEISEVHLMPGASPRLYIATLAGVYMDMP